MEGRGRGRGKGREREGGRGGGGVIRATDDEGQERSNGG